MAWGHSDGRGEMEGEDKDSDVSELESPAMLEEAAETRQTKSSSARMNSDISFHFFEWPS